MSLGPPVEGALHPGLLPVGFLLNREDGGGGALRAPSGSEGQARVKPKTILKGLTGHGCMSCSSLGRWHQSTKLISMEELFCAGFPCPRPRP